MEGKHVTLSRELLFDNVNGKVSNEHNVNSNDSTDDHDQRKNGLSDSTNQNDQTLLDLKPKNLGFTRTLLLAMFAAMIGTGAQFGYALGVMNAPSEVSEISLVIFRYSRKINLCAS